MWDIEFTRKAFSFGGAMVYRYRTGAWRSKIFATLSRLAAQNEASLAGCDVDELCALWTSQGLFDAIRVCDVRPLKRPSLAELRTISDLLATEPAVPTVIAVKATAADLPETGRARVLYVDEPTCDQSNIDAVITALEAQVCGGSTTLTKQNSFGRHIRRWMGVEAQIELPEVIAEVERCFLMHTDRKTGIFLSPPESEVEFNDRSYLLRSMRQFVVCAQDFERIDFLRSISLRQRRGDSPREIISDICRATQNLLLAPAGPHAEASAKGRRGQQIALKQDRGVLIWAALIFAFARTALDESLQASLSSSEDLVVDLERLCRNFVDQLLIFDADPLCGHWAALNRAFTKLNSLEEEEVNAAARLGLAIREFLGSLSQTAWIKRLAHIADRPREPGAVVELLDSPVAFREPSSFGELIGQEEAIRQLVRSSGQRERTFLLEGPVGVGKRTLARIFARTIMCEAAPALPGSPCGICNSCAGFDDGNFGYIELDVSQSNAIVTLREHVQKLRSSSFSKHRVVVIANPEDSQALDVMLGSLEQGATDTTFFVLAQDQNAVRAATLSRSIIVQIKPLEEEMLPLLIFRWLNGASIDGDVVRLVSKASGGLPGRLAELVQAVSNCRDRTLAAVKERLGVSWGLWALSYWNKLLTDEACCADKLAVPATLEVREAVRRIQGVLLHLRTDETIVEPALVGLEERLADLTKRFRGRARSENWETLWAATAEIWINDAIVDAETFRSAAFSTRVLLS